ncbi:GGDEF domain-containing protein [Permianibacter sp. IMCC34836]|uniref:tetratricopeptide repeat-containing diguanylate cyclase n=1 Tax=Permianibacter fluminis TaxID=2738515 RepID=UPI001553DCF6|nr:diguanylate cyclase [Permianibacter fluminis]NQD39065.1 GGDEF domain-containing protein [Permianibacter fluminis]
MPSWAAAEQDESRWLAEIASIRALTDEAATQQAVAALAKQIPAERTPELEYQWLSLQLAMAYLREDSAQAQQLTDALAALAQRSGLVAPRIESMVAQAQNLKDAGKPAEGLALMREALALLQKVSDLRLRYLVHNRAGILYSDVSDFENALAEHLQALPLAEQSGPQRAPRELQTLNNLGALYLNLRQPDQALSYLQRALPLAEAGGNKRMLATLNLNLGYALSSLGRHDESKTASLKALQLAREIGERSSETTALTNLSDDALQRKDFDEAINYAQQSLVLAQQIKAVSTEAIARANIGIALVGKGLHRQGLQELRLSRQTFQSIGDLATEDLVLTELGTAAETAGEQAEAIASLRRQISVREQLFSASRQRAVTELQERFDATARQKQIELLERENQLQSAEIDNRRLFQWVVGLVALTVVLAGAVVTLSYWRVRDANRRLQAANAQLADQSIRDPLTGLFNRRSFQLAMDRRWNEQERRTDSDTTVDAFVLLDIDHFKRINDSFGHAAGDAVLIEVAKRLSSGMRDRDMVLRWGGEEFLLYIRGTTSEALQDVVARVLARLGTTPVEHDGKAIAVTASAGFVPLPFGDLPEAEFGWERAVLLADLALYLGKGRGRNRAYGVLKVNGNYQEIAPALEQNLAHAIRHHLVTAVEVLGPGAAPAEEDD